MYVAFIICAAFAVLITAIPSQDQPPRDSDPDCNIPQNETQAHVYLNCTYVCQLDEVIYLSGNESCYLGNPNSSNQGICVNGTCIPLLEQTTEDTTDSEISIETTAPPKPPGCDDNTSGVSIRGNYYCILHKITVHNLHYL
uniref:Putative gamma-aminobutyric acid gaba-a receptor subunit epsilon n=1 Tax=Amblyomma tuberculatum TaxID=48802 RepID=A0A6M2E316_9ACAR